MGELSMFNNGHCLLTSRFLNQYYYAQTFVKIIMVDY